AHNTSWKSLGVYRFLTALQAEGAVDGTSWNWGPLESQPRLPRVRFGRILLARQQWNARRTEVQMLRSHDGHLAFRAVQEWRAQRRLPRWVGLVDFDNVLPIDLDHPLSVAAFLDEIRGVEGFVLQEIFPGGRTDAARSPEGRFFNEIIIPCIRHAPAKETTPAPHAYVRTTAVSDGTFAPGSEWITAKLYCGPAVLDRVLLEVVAPLVEQAEAQGWIKRWFFVRYADPDWHARVRFCGDRRRLLADVLPRMHDCAQAFLENRRIHRIQLDGYRRESIRYGGERGIILCEEIFAADSRAVVDFLSEATGDDGLDARWRFCSMAMDALLSDFEFSPARKLECMRLLAKEYGAEFHIDSALRRRMMNRYRSERRALEDLLEDRDGTAPSTWRAVLRERSAHIRSACAELLRLRAAGSLTADPHDLAASLLHMHANRVLRSSPRAQEMVIYHYLENVYASRAARAKALSPTTSP
ncbi:MAG TPA: thiopeptide-type bacteriocin biosynthesis protein, partial [bacterium]|nr:thiopeptide-type bacteriocin biosynthesis protein [bacterium]